MVEWEPGTMKNYERLRRTNAPKSLAYLMIGLAVFVSGGSLILFAVFLYAGSLSLVELGLDDARKMWLDSFLCLFFFVQHSSMIRKTIQDWLKEFIPSHYYGVFYAISSGMSLLVLIIFWQETSRTVVVFEDAARLLSRMMYFTSIIGLIWSAHSLRSFDIVGRGRLLAQMHNRQLPAMPFAICGPYRFVRHPFYFFVLLMIWSYPDVTIDRLLLSSLWSVWVVVGTVLEERDLVVSFGVNYRNYQAKVPMLIPWRISLKVLSNCCN